MVKVNRTAEPQSLVQNAVAWRNELLNQIQVNGTFSAVPDRYKNLYNQADVKAALETMYGEKCCYCEGIIGECSYGNIEHLKPKSRFHDLTFAWGNLHWCCPVCNNKKRDKWNSADPILDPTVDDPDDHLEFDLVNCKIRPKNSSRAQTTIEHAKLNRPELVVKRKRLKTRILRILMQAESSTSQQDRDFYRQELLRLAVNDPANGDIAEHSLFVRALLAQSGL
ncbi:TIGR02646 family protein [Tumebacillus avium]|uniref:TIGR02646 family protein n=1 Tax=Tumebacillus avium TaxID=1903704 RepID=A0A1Y0IN04_9BACL|nr:retron system putative HNH endonuclease [Tumebacillus avium]ARU60734.1 TIGR02646 family protein [Tumebacillus avium]